MAQLHRTGNVKYAIRSDKTEWIFYNSHTLFIYMYLCLQRRIAQNTGDFFYFVSLSAASS